MTPFLFRRFLFAATLALIFSSCYLEKSRARSPSPPAPVRIITLAPNLTEIVAFIGCGGSIVGTDDFSDFPDPIKAVRKIGGVQPSIEAIVALEPTWVIGSNEGSHPRLAGGLARAGVHSLLVGTSRLADIEIVMRQLAMQLAGCASFERAALFKAALARERRQRSRKPRTLFIVWTNPLYVAGRATFLDDLFHWTGAVNAVPDTVTGWPQYSREPLMLNPPDIVLFPTRSVTREQATALFGPEISRRVVFAPVDEDEFTRPGPRLVDAARELNRVFDAWERSR